MESQNRLSTTAIRSFELTLRDAGAPKMHKIRSASVTVGRRTVESIDRITDVAKVELVARDRCRGQLAVKVAQ